MAAITLYYADSTVDSWRRLTETAQTAATANNGWVVGAGSTLHSKYASAAGERIIGTFDATTYPDGTLDTTLFDAFRSENAYTGSFANANWTFNFNVTAVTSATGQDGRIRFRLFMADADGSNATEITSAQQQGSLITNLGTAPGSSSTLTVNPGAFTIASQYLFVQLAWERTGAATMANADVNFRTGSSGPAGTFVTTADFTMTGALMAGSVTGTAAVSGTLSDAPPTFAQVRQAIIDGLVSAQSEGTGWNAQRTNIPTTAVVRTSDTVVTITLPALSGYDITAQETITATVPAVAVAGASPIVATPTMTIDTAAGAALFQASVTATATTSAALTTAISLQASVTATASVTAPLTTVIRFQSAVTGTGAATGSLTTAVTLAASLSATATTTADLSVPGAAAQFQASVLGAATTTGALTTAIPLQASASGSATTTAALTTTVTFATATTGTATVSGTLSDAAAAATFAAAVTGTATTTATLTIGADLFAASVTATASATGALTTAIPLAATVTGTATVSANLSVFGLIVTIHPAGLDVFQAVAAGISVNVSADAGLDAFAEATSGIDALVSVGAGLDQQATGSAGLDVFQPVPMTYGCAFFFRSSSSTICRAARPKADVYLADAALTSWACSPSPLKIGSGANAFISAT